MEAASPVIERGDVFLPKDQAWIADFLDEVLGFPNAKHDDQVDAFSQLLNWAERRPGSLGKEAHIPGFGSKVIDCSTGREIPTAPHTSGAPLNLYGKVIGPHGEEY